MRRIGDLQNAVTRAVLEVFRPRFVPAARVLWVREASETAAYVSEVDLLKLSLDRARKCLFPNIVFHNEVGGLLVLVDVASIRGPISPMRCDALKRVFGICGIGLLLITAFESRREFQDLLVEPPWGTSAWFENEPKNMIHFDSRWASRPV
jgi:hypothetical protein